ncbi:phosphonate ABC transporter, permease protein PhnE [Pseudalkalibacillus hwajinpoensis]|uniref:Phosphonate ABC transporter, permease protein PhnE n=2 Tax=Guptibacillus hwajinpoensis TaxID=208199 RepID=A0A4U1MLS2_9BACL|nr:phosphonate ABC transporter, permease protein PhnE [Pseudalkalibacillus hwajinpoensis]TKD71585.1 phosphonate ABC transporter, permease protein PhnE [Pseudalkalibacillus hwajinpoensis]
MVWFKWKHLFIFIVVIGFMVWSARVTEFDIRKFSQFNNMVDFLSNWFPLNTSIIPKMLEASLVTLGMAFLGSFAGLLVALPISLLAAKNTAGRFYGIVRIMLSFVRSIPEIVLGLMFLTVVGPGPFAATIAIIVHNASVLSKLIAELIEAADKGPQEAMNAVGARSLTGALFSIFPQIWPNVLSHFFYRFEVAIRTSLILGLVGGGGIGQQLFVHFKTFQYSTVAVDVFIIMFIVIAVDFLGSRVRQYVM